MRVGPREVFEMSRPGGGWGGVGDWAKKVEPKKGKTEWWVRGNFSGALGLSQGLRGEDDSCYGEAEGCG